MQFSDCSGVAWRSRGTGGNALHFGKVNAIGEPKNRVKLDCHWFPCLLTLRNFERGAYFKNFGVIQLFTYLQYLRL